MKAREIFSFKFAVGLLILLFSVVTFIAASNVNESKVETDAQGNITVDFKDADIQNVMRILSLKGGVNIVADPDVKGMVTIRLSNVYWEKALDVICKTYGYAYEREANIIRVTTIEKLGQENLVTEVFTLNFGKAKDCASSISEMKSERGKIKYDERANLIIVTDIPTNVYKIGQIIARLDSITPQVTIEAKIVETSLNNSEQLGINWNAQLTVTGSKRPHTFPWEKEKSYGYQTDKFLPEGDSATGFIGGKTIPSFPFAAADEFSFGTLDASTFSIVMEALLSRGKTKILSNPRITTLDNQPAKIHVGTDWPIANYTYNEEQDRFVVTGWQYKSYGILLEVNPTVNQNGYVTLTIKPEISDRESDITFEGAQVPVLSTRTAEAKVMVKDGETLVVGGLIKDKTVSTKSKVPILGDIPLVGLLFTHKNDTLERRDLLIFITPHIVSPGIVSARLDKATAQALESASTVPVPVPADVQAPQPQEAVNVKETPAVPVSKEKGRKKR